MTVDGRDRIPSTGPYLIVFNHLHWMDLPVIFTQLEHEVAGLAQRRVADWPVVGTIARLMGHAIWVQNETDHRAMAEALRWLRGGGALLVAPEGGRSATRSLQPGRPGAAYLAIRSGAPVVPLAAWGHEHLFADWLRFRRGHVHLEVGWPLVLEGAPSRARGAELERHTDRIMAALAALLPPEYRGAYNGASAHHR